MLKIQTTFERGIDSQIAHAICSPLKGAPSASKMLFAFCRTLDTSYLV